MAASAITNGILTACARRSGFLLVARRRARRFALVGQDVAGA